MCFRRCYRRPEDSRCSLPVTNLSSPSSCPPLPHLRSTVSHRAGCLNIAERERRVPVALFVAAAANVPCQSAHQVEEDGPGAVQAEARCQLVELEAADDSDAHWQVTVSSSGYNVASFIAVTLTVVRTEIGLEICLVTRLMPCGSCHSVRRESGRPASAALGRRKWRLREPEDLLLGA